MPTLTWIGFLLILTCYSPTSFSYQHRGPVVKKHQTQVRRAQNRRNKIAKFKNKLINTNIDANKLKIKEKISKQAKVYLKYLDKAKQHHPVKKTKKSTPTHKKTPSAEHKAAHKQPQQTHTPANMAPPSHNQFSTETIITATVNDYSEPNLAES